MQVIACDAPLITTGVDRVLRRKIYGNIDAKALNPPDSREKIVASAYAEIVCDSDSPRPRISIGERLTIIGSRFEIGVLLRDSRHDRRHWAWKFGVFGKSRVAVSIVGLAPNSLS